MFVDETIGHGQCAKVTKKDFNISKNRSLSIRTSVFSEF